MFASCASIKSSFLPITFYILASKQCHLNKIQFTYSLHLHVDGFHPKDLLRINQDSWMANFLVANDYNMKESLKQCWDTLEWRKKFGVNGTLSYALF
jgi:hypothetical protein